MLTTILIILCVLVGATLIFIGGYMLGKHKGIEEVYETDKYFYEHDD